MQGLCRLAGIPCVGAGVLGSAVGMDKDVMKRLLRDAGIPTARFVAVGRAAPMPTFSETVAALGSPLFVKPANLGSSVGVSKARTAAEFADALRLAFRYDTKAIVEEFVEGRELECSVLGNDDPIASVPGEVLPSHEFYDYEAKYLDEHGAALEIPARLAPATVDAVRALAVTGVQGPVLQRHGPGGPVPAPRRRAARERDQHHSRASPVSACTPSCGKRAASPTASWWAGSSRSRIERHETERGLATTV